MAENPTEFHDIPLTWLRNATSVPDWMGGTFVRNGPAQITFGKDKHFLGSWLDGFAKLNSFKLRGKNQVLFSGKMLESTTYMDSVAAGTIVPQLTLNKFKEGTPEWSFWDVMKITKRMMSADPKHNGFDNTNPGLWRTGSPSKPTYFATTDTPLVTQFNISNLATLAILKPDGEQPLTGCTHWVREPGTENSINFVTRGSVMGGKTSIEVQRLKPETDYSKPEIVATFPIDAVHMVHSFSITENHTVLFFYPLIMNMMSVFGAKFHALEVVEYKEAMDTRIVVVNMKSGSVKQFSAKTLYAYHHINAYEVNNGSEIILDMSPSDPNGLKDYPALKNMMNPPQESTGINGSTTGPYETTRYRINLQNGIISDSTFPNVLQNRYVNKFDFPVINEAYRGKKYCITYGVSAFDYSRTALVKKNVCDSNQDKVIYVENNYVSEMFFIANPKGTSEDDGVVVTNVFDGEKEQSYFLVLDAATFEELDRAYMPHAIPWAAHGMHYPEAQF